MAGVPILTLLLTAACALLSVVCTDGKELPRLRISRRKVLTRSDYRAAREWISSIAMKKFQLKPVSTSWNGIRYAIPDGFYLFTSGTHIRDCYAWTRRLEICECVLAS